MPLHPSPFFHLPRELRDTIYTSILTPQPYFTIQLTAIPAQHQLSIAITTSAEPLRTNNPIAQVSRQIRDEVFALLASFPRVQPFEMRWPGEPSSLVVPLGVFADVRREVWRGVMERAWELREGEGCVEKEERGAEWPEGVERVRITGTCFPAVSPWSGESMVELAFGLKGFERLGSVEVEVSMRGVATCLGLPLAEERFTCRKCRRTKTHTSFRLADVQNLTIEAILAIPALRILAGQPGLTLVHKAPPPRPSTAISSFHAFHQPCQCLYPENYFDVEECFGRKIRDVNLMLGQKRGLRMGCEEQKGMARGFETVGLQALKNRSFASEL